ncbi:hypothetical protein [Umezawaea sp. Da 62-37]|nr:hypothetical protein [Umezawaea sp. Da 62-37]WNV90372.1 hypothetical protein RM788_19450 [Umezawaea sp. Da 62-37]
MLTAAFFGGLGPFFLAGLLGEEIGIWFTHRKAQHLAAEFSPL